MVLPNSILIDGTSPPVVLTHNSFYTIAILRASDAVALEGRSLDE